MVEIIEQQSFTEQRIIDFLTTGYGLEVATLTYIPLGADIDAKVYKAQAEDQSSYFVKLKKGTNHDIGVVLQSLLHDVGIAQIISPIKTIHGKSTLHIDNFTLIVYPFIEGQDGFSKNLTLDQWVELGKVLKQIHTFDVPQSIKNHIKKEDYSAVWRNAVKSIYHAIDAQEIVTDEVGLNVIVFIQKHRKTIENLVHHAEQLAQKITKQFTEFVLCHSDIHAGNVLIANDGTMYIVDWDQPIMAPKERDLMFIGGGAGNVWNNQEEEEWFYQGYGKTEINKDILAYYRYQRIVEDIAIYSKQLFLTTEDDKEREVMYQNFIDIFKPNGVVDIAFRTDAEFLKHF